MTQSTHKIKKRGKTQAENDTFISAHGSLQPLSLNGYFRFTNSNLNLQLGLNMLLSYVMLPVKY